MRQTVVRLALALGAATLLAACAPGRSTSPNATSIRATHQTLERALASTHFSLQQSDSAGFPYISWTVPSGATSWTASVRFHIYQYGRDSLGHDHSSWSWKVDPIFTSSTLTSYYDNNPRHTWTDNNYCSDSSDDFEVYAYYWVIFSFNGSQKDTASNVANFISTNPDSCASSAH